MYILEPLIPPAKAGGRPRTVNIREIINAIFYILALWRSLAADAPRPTALLVNGLLLRTVVAYIRVLAAA